MAYILIAKALKRMLHLNLLGNVISLCEAYMCGDLGKAMRSWQISFHVKWLNVNFLANDSHYFGEFENSLKTN